MTVKIETYRGIEIVFNTDRSTFSCILNDYGKESKSFDAVKKGIDEYIKDNNTFSPFEIIAAPYSYKKFKKYTVIGIRKDNRFILKDIKGEQSQLSEYDEKSHCLYSPELEPLLVEIAVAESEVNAEQ